MMGTDLIDIVCGRPVAVTSQHRHVHGGALYCFCSDECRTRFVSDLLRLASTDASAPGRMTSPAGGSGYGPAATPHRSQGLDVADSIAQLRKSYRLRHQSPESHRVAVAPGSAVEHMHRGPVATPNVEKPAAPKPVAAAGAGMSGESRQTGAIASAMVMRLEPARSADRLSPRDRQLDEARASAANAPTAIGRARAVVSMLPASLLAWREKRFAIRISRELLTLHGAVSSRHPNLAGRDLYRQIVAVRTGADAAAVEAVLEGAERSFADWPANRDLKFCDIVNYLAASEFFATHRGNRWIQTDLKHIIAARIPRDL